MNIGTDSIAFLIRKITFEQTMKLILTIAGIFLVDITPVFQAGTALDVIFVLLLLRNLSSSSSSSSSLFIQKRQFLHAKLGLDVHPLSNPSTHFWKLPIRATDQVISCPSHILPKSSCPFFPPPLCSFFCRPTPNHPHFYAQDAPTISICHASPHQPHSEYSRILYLTET